jgi:Kef-type K+ transport system membrane component KefB
VGRSDSGSGPRDGEESGGDVTLGSLDLARLLFALALLLVSAHVVGAVFAAVRQPRVIGEIVGGLLLGPTVFGGLAPGVQAEVFPKSGVTGVTVGVFYQLGLLLLLFCSGVETRAVFRRGDERAVGAITVVGMAIPFLLGLGLVQVLNTSSLTGTAHSDTALILVFALAIAVTSIPVISRIMFDLGILHTSFARIVLGVAVIEDTLVYVGLAIAVGIAGAATGEHAVGVPALLGLEPGTAASITFHIVATLAFFAVMLAAAPALARRTASSRIRVLSLGIDSPIAQQLVFVLTATLGCVLLGVTPMLGAFLAGIVAASVPGTAGAAARGAVKDFAFGFFVPVYFAIVGLQLDLLHHFNPVFFAWFLGFACAAKALSVYLGARIGGESSKSALNLAVALNARGGPGIVLASITYTAGIINQEFYACLVLMAIVTSLVAGSWLGRVVRLGRDLRPQPVVVANGTKPSSDRDKAALPSPRTPSAASDIGAAAVDREPLR